MVSLTLRYTEVLYRPGYLLGYSSRVLYVARSQVRPIFPEQDFGSRRNLCSFKYRLDNSNVNGRMLISHYSWGEQRFITMPAQVATLRDWLQWEQTSQRCIFGIYFKSPPPLKGQMTEGDQQHLPPQRFKNVCCPGSVFCMDTWKKNPDRHLKSPLILACDFQDASLEAL